MTGRIRRAPARALRWWRWALLGALPGLVALTGLGGGAALVWFAAPGAGSGQASAGVPVAVTVQAVPSSAALLPGLASPVTVSLANPDGTGARFTEVTGAAVTSGDPGACPSGDVGIPPLPYPLSPPLVVAPHATSGAQPIAGLVTLSTTAPPTCQGVAFTVTLTLSGMST